jgi:sulfate adenylyltransferase (ADP) / ATP adenylyltransferase
VARGLIAGSLRTALRARTAGALASGVLRPIETVEEFVEDAGVRFVLRRVSSLARKAEDRQRSHRDTQANPFLPWEPALFVADLTPSHVALLNKFNVIDYHLLIVTREFEHQERLLTRADFEALWVRMAEFDGLGFYNGGEVAGASQPHKHLQMVPLPLASKGPPVPVEPLLEAAPRTGISAVPGFPFASAFCRLHNGIERDPAAAEITERLYLGLLAAVGISPVACDDGPRQSAPYNLLVTRGWMLLVPRSKECFESISVNALGYAGSLFVRDAAQAARLRAGGPMAVLAGIGMPCG